MIDDNGGSQTAKDLLKTLSHSIAYVGNRNINGKGQPLLILAPQHARLISLGGTANRMSKHWLRERARVLFGDFPTTGKYSQDTSFYADLMTITACHFAERPRHRDRGIGGSVSPASPGKPASRRRTYHADSAPGGDSLETMPDVHPSHSDCWSPPWWVSWECVSAVTWRAPPTEITRSGRSDVSVSLPAGRRSRRLPGGDRLRALRTAGCGETPGCERSSPQNPSDSQPDFTPC